MVGLQPSAWFPAAAWLPSPQGTWGAGVCGGTGDASRAGRAAAGSTALLVVVGPEQELGRGCAACPRSGSHRQEKSPSLQRRQPG